MRCWTGTHCARLLGNARRIESAAFTLHCRLTAASTDQSRDRVGARTVELALELGEHQGDGLGGAGGGGHDVERRGARAAQVPVARVQQPPVCAGATINDVLESKQIA